MEACECCPEHASGCPPNAPLPCNDLYAPPSASSISPSGTCGGDAQLDYENGRGCPYRADCGLGCCLGEYNEWCHDNYKEGFYCENNACGGDDCCVPAGLPYFRILLGGAAGVALIVCIFIHVKLKPCAKPQQQLAPAGPSGMQMASSSSSVPMAVAQPMAMGEVVPMGSALAPVERLEQLKDMVGRGLITQAEHDAKRAEILATL